MKNLKEEREEFYKRIPNYWANMYGQEYSLLDAYIVSETESKNVRAAAKRIGHIFSKVSQLLRNVDDNTLWQMGFEKEVLPYLRLKDMPMESVISRLDLVKVDGDYKVMEINSDTPTFIKELFHVNGIVTTELKLKDPNKNEEKKLQEVIRTAVYEACKSIGKEINPNIVFTAHGESEEDTYTVQYLKELGGMPSKYVPLQELRIVEGEGLLDSEGQIIDVLYRQTFPIENLILDKDPETQEKVGLQLLDLVRNKKLAIINPISAFLMQTKALQAVIWGLHEQQHPYLNSEEHTWIQRYFLPTYLEAEQFLLQGIPYVKKPCFGREGDTVEIYDSKGRKVIEDENKTYSEYVSVYQEYVDLPKTSFMTEKGEKEGHIVIGCFLLNGEPSAFGYRVGNRITDNLSCFLPVGTY
ncbi:glutathionylspermidine synthase family protein [Priestia filamentosa]|uniref:glutathionylspermidine synthase family protein n=1 Tax=Priestia filamentosa TaxID=1402861 RepID=UPI00397893BC